MPLNETTYIIHGIISNNEKAIKNQSPYTYIEFTTIKRLHLLIALLNANFPFTSSQSLRAKFGLVKIYYFDLLAH